MIFSEKAVKRLREWASELKKSGRKYDHEDMKSLFEAARGCDSVNRWGHEVVNGMLHDFISELDHDYWEWMYSIGDEYPARIRGYLIGLKMASEQLRGEESK